MRGRRRAVWRRVVAVALAVGVTAVVGVLAPASAAAGGPERAPGKPSAPPAHPASEPAEAGVLDHPLAPVGVLVVTVVVFVGGLWLPQVVADRQRRCHDGRLDP